MRSALGVSLMLVAVGVMGCSESSTAPRTVTPGSASFSAGGKTAQATGSGNFTYLGEWRNFAFNAQKGADGSVTGQMQVNNRAQDRFSHYTVTCMGVVGNHAFLGVNVASSNDPSVVGLNGILAVVDNGEGANAPPDQVSLVQLGYDAATVAQWCNGVYSINSFPLYNIEAGNIQIH